MSEILRITPQKVAQTNIYYNIPIYQRLFEWDEDKICTLLNDLYTAYIYSSEPYYIGMFTANSNLFEEQDLVDGQQRFTVSTLIGVIFKEYYVDWEKFLLVNGAPRLRFTAREEDYNFLRNIIDNKTFLMDILYSAEIDCYSNKRMREGLKTINKWILEVKETSEKVNFAKYVYEQMSFFITDLPKEYKTKDLNRYFETMNSLGRNLESHEILQVDCLKLREFDEL